MTDDYKTGYGKPPKKSQFKKGQSGNPKGRPRNTKHTGTDVAAILDEPVIIRKAGVAHKISSFEASIRRLTILALNNKDLRAIRNFIKQCEKYGVIVPSPAPAAGGGVLVIPKGEDFEATVEKLKRGELSPDDFRPASTRKN